jgi:hypothetical protein
MFTGDEPLFHKWNRDIIMLIGHDCLPVFR